MEYIILTGPKNSGKTSAAKVFSKLYAYNFLDLDELISQGTGESPRQLYNKGQDIFQAAEADALAALFKLNKNNPKRRRQFVMAAGGGIIDNEKAISLIKENSHIIVYLDVPADIAWNRIISSSNGELPPFLQSGNPQETHRILHERRAVAYLQLANIIIKAGGKTPEEIAVEIFANLKNF
ncbi:MAG: shikimate kinase [Treponema sp.]|nr:shikimate kinase [Treponema sp.]